VMGPGILTARLRSARHLRRGLCLVRMRRAMWCFIASGLVLLLGLLFFGERSGRVTTGSTPDPVGLMAGDWRQSI
jgi:hypothetical protein